MITKIEHIGIAVKNMDNAVALYEQLLGTPCYKKEEVDSEKVMTAFFKTGESKVELLSATEESSVIAGFIAKRGEGIHHIAFDVDNIEAEMERLKGLGYTLLQEKPKRGADNKLVAFVHPKNCNGVLVELCQSIPEKID
ncbi:MAG: methylmalonyl-CoA epimerase [Balneolales bacterium]|nr:methylmalonyl-CoA epimerase [Balneolales bacterium]